MTILSVVAAILASQALICGVFSLLTQAHALGMFPRILVLHTNPDERGQVYVPEVNFALCALCIVLCIAFRNSTALAGAYGISVTGTFIVTTILLLMAFRYVWCWSWLAILPIIVPMLLVDLMFWSSNMAKVLSSGWVPLALAAVMCLLLMTYSWGRSRENHIVEPEKEERMKRVLKMTDSEGFRGAWVPSINDIETLSNVLHSGALQRSQTAAVFLTPELGKVPRSLSVLAQSFRSLPSVIVLLSVSTEAVPFIAEGDRSELKVLDADCGLYGIILRFGYAEPLTAERFALQQRLQSIVAENIETHPVLALWGDVRCKDGGIEQGTEQVDLSQDVPNDGEDIEMGAVVMDTAEGRTERHVLYENQPGVTFIFNRLHYVPMPEQGLLKVARLRLYSWLVLNARKPIPFFGLEACNTMEISSVRFM
jgi:KUP system potassium uptake protein